MLGTSIGAYMIDRELGAGGMGRVFEAHTRREVAGLAPGTTVALKIVHPHLLEAEGFFKRFLREADLGRRIDHENVVRTLDCDQLVVDGQVRCFLAMEYVRGQTLAGLLAEMERVPEELCLHAAQEICKGLHAIHELGIVHRDLKPENVLITAEHVVKLMDLGVARLVDEQLRLSRSGAFVGSAAYASPEQFGGEVDHRSDLHSLGVLLYELAAGELPYGGDSFRAVMHRVCTEEPRRLGERNPQLSAFFEEVVHQLLCKDPADRFADAATLLGVLEAGEDSSWWRERSRRIQAATRRPIRRIRIPRETAVHGRDDELAALRRLYENAKGGDGAVVLLDGEAGVGKSRLVDELVARLHADGEDLNFLFGAYPPGGATTAAGGFPAAFREQFGELGSAPYLARTPLLTPAFDAVLRGETVPEGAPALTAESLGTCYVNATRSLADERPTILLLDDLHFAPEAARKLFTALAHAISGHRVLLIGTLRPGPSDAWAAELARLDHATRIHVRRLGSADLTRLLRDALRSERLAEELGARVARKSDGNPLFVFEILRGLREGRYLTQRDDGTWVGTGVVDEIEIPSSVQDLVNARLEQVEQEDRDLLEVAACAGFQFDPTLVGEVLGLNRIVVLKRLGSVERRHRLVRGAGRKMIFDHHQVRAALYDGLLEPLREAYHSALGEALEERAGAAAAEPDELDGALCLSLCDHFLRGAQPGRALRYLERAEAHLGAGHRHEETIDLVERALAAAGGLSGKPRARALLRLCVALSHLGRRDRQESCASEAERLATTAGSDALLMSASAAMAKLYLGTGRMKEAEDAYRRSVELARTLGDEGSEAIALANLGSVVKVLGRIDEARELQEQASELFRRDGDRSGEAQSLGNLANIAKGQGRFDRAWELHERALSLYCELGDRVGEARTTGNLGNVAKALGRLADAQEFQERALAIHREIGVRVGESISLLNLGNVLAARGRLDEARSCHERALDLFRESSLATGQCYALLNLGGVLLDEGDDAAGEARFVDCLALAERIGHRQLQASAQLALGELRAVRARSTGGDPEEARVSLTAARDLAVGIGAPGLETLARCELALLEGGDPHDGVAAYEEHEGALDVEQRRRALLLLWRATGDPTRLVEARRLLDDALARAVADDREGMATRLRANRELLSEWHREFGDDPGETEAVTRVDA